MANQTYKIEAIFQRVYGHQDTKSRGEMLTEAILNVKSDRLVGKYQEELGAYSPITHIYSLAPVVLEINEMTITSNIRRQLIKAYADPKYI